jgi:hypothetical protein
LSLDGTFNRSGFSRFINSPAGRVFRLAASGAKIRAAYRPAG